MKLTEQIAHAEAAATQAAIKRYEKNTSTQLVGCVRRHMDAIEEVIASAARANLAHAHEVGRALLALKERLPHGDYLPELKRYGINRKTAARCTQIAAYWPLLPKRDETGKPLSITTAQQLCTDISRRAAAEQTDGDGDGEKKARPPVVAERPSPASFAAYLDKLGFYAEQFPDRALPIIEAMLKELGELRAAVRGKLAEQETAAALAQAAAPKEAA